MKIARGLTASRLQVCLTPPSDITACVRISISFKTPESTNTLSADSRLSFGVIVCKKSFNSEDLLYHISNPSESEKPPEIKMGCSQN